jgi:hypothetical protein
MIKVDLDHVLGFAVTILTLLGFGFAGLRWLRGWLRRYLLPTITSVHNEMTSENSGSMKETVNRIDGDVQTLKHRFTDHLHYHDHDYDASRGKDERPRL